MSSGEGTGCLIVILGIIALIYFAVKILLTLLIWLIIVVIFFSFAALIILNTLLALAIFLIIPVSAIWIFVINCKRMKDANYNNTTIIPISILTIGLGVSTGFWFNLKVWQQFLSILGIAVKLEVSKLFLLALILGTGIILAIIIIYPPLNKARQILKYRRKQQHLIKP